VKTFRTVVSSASSLPFRDSSSDRGALRRLPLQLALGSCLSLLALSAGCAGDDAKKVVSVGEGGESGETGAPSGGGTDASTQTGAGGASDPGGAGKGNAGERAAQAEGGAGGAPGTALAGAAANGEAGAFSAAGAAAAGEGGAPSFPVSSCGEGMWMASEVGCQPCPAANQVFEMACADYEDGQILLNSGQPQFAFASLPDGVQGHEASPVDVSVTYVTPDESHLRTVRLSTNAWSVDLSQAAAQPEALVIPPFSTADVCGDVFRSLEPVRFNRVGEGQGASYEMVCP
jgi:hypothetical protein